MKTVGGKCSRFSLLLPESAQLWKEVLADLQRRGLAEPLLFVGDGLSGLEEAIKWIYPKADFQSCLLHKMRQSLARARRREREALAEDLRQVVHQRDPIGFQQAFGEFERAWGEPTRKWFPPGRKIDPF
jgi:putative transposase